MVVPSSFGPTNLLWTHKRNFGIVLNRFNDFADNQSMTSFRNKTFFLLLLSAFLFAGAVGCTSSPPGESKNPFSAFQGGKKAAAPKKVEKEFNTVGEFVGAERPSF